VDSTGVNNKGVETENIFLLLKKLLGAVAVYTFRLIQGFFFVLFYSSKTG
jgi:hypothetical protein